jgi:hypothetical protein
VYELTHQSSGGRSYLCFDVPEGAELDERTLNAQLANDVPGLAKLSRLDKFGAEQLRFNVTSRIPLSQFLAVPVPEDSLMGVVRSIVGCWRNLRRFQIQPNCVVLNPDYVYVAVAEQRAELICLPVRQANTPDLVAFLRSVLGRAVLRQGAGYQLYGQLMSLLNQPDASVEQVAAVVDPPSPPSQSPAAVAAAPVTRTQAPRPQTPAGPPPQSPPPQPGRTSGSVSTQPAWSPQPSSGQAVAPMAPVPMAPAPVATPTGSSLPGPGFAVPGGPAFQTTPSKKKRGIEVPPVAPPLANGEKQVSAMRGIFGSKADTEAWRRQKAAKKAGGPVPQGAPPQAPAADTKHVSAMRGMFGSKADTEAWRQQKAAQRAAKQAAGSAPQPPVPQPPRGGMPSAPPPYPPPPGADPRLTSSAPQGAPPGPPAMPPPGGPGPQQASGPASSANFGGTVDFSQSPRQVPGHVQGTTLIGTPSATDGATKRRVVVHRRTGRQAIIEKPEFALGRDSR